VGGVKGVPLPGAGEGQELGKPEDDAAGYALPQYADGDKGDRHRGTGGNHWFMIGPGFQGKPPGTVAFKQDQVVGGDQAFKKAGGQGLQFARPPVQ
jgi:hypothetical protein